MTHPDIPDTKLGRAPALVAACVLFAGISAGHALSPEYLPATMALAVLLAVPAATRTARSLRRPEGANAVDTSRQIGNSDDATRHRRRWRGDGSGPALATDCMLLLSFALTGAALHSSAHFLVPPDDISLLPTQVEIHAEALVREVRYPEQRRPRAVVAVRRLGIGGAESRPTSGFIWVTLPKGAPTLRRGDVALMIGTTEIPAGGPGF